jgi:hypothetical protein
MPAIQCRKGLFCINAMLNITDRRVLSLRLDLSEGYWAN